MLNTLHLTDKKVASASHTGFKAMLLLPCKSPEGSRTRFRMWTFSLHRFVRCLSPGELLGPRKYLASLMLQFRSLIGLDQISDPDANVSNMHLVSSGLSRVDMAWRSSRLFED